MVARDRAAGLGAWLDQVVEDTDVYSPYQDSWPRQFEGELRNVNLYDSYEAAWLGYYHVTYEPGAVYQAVCDGHAQGEGCGKVFRDIDDERLRKTIERHIVRNGEAVHKYPTPDYRGEIPY